MESLVEFYSVDIHIALILGLYYQKNGFHRGILHDVLKITVFFLKIGDDKQGCRLSAFKFPAFFYDLRQWFCIRSDF